MYATLTMTSEPILTAPIFDVVGELPCQGDASDGWFAEKPAELEIAKSLCIGCPVRAQCLTSAIERREPWGVWGGEIFDQGVIVARKRGRGRPRKSQASSTVPEQAA